MSITAHQLAEAQALLAQNWKQSAIAAHLGLTAPTLCRQLQRAANGEDLGPRHATGPRDRHQLTPQEAATATLGMLQKNSRKLAALMLMDSDHCTPETYEKLVAIFDHAEEQRTDEVWPTWWQRACYLTQEQRAAFRGAKHLAGLEPARPRGRFYVDDEGNRYPMMPNGAWEFDDQSHNRPRVEVDENGVARINRQTLYAIDYDSAMCLGARHIDRASDGYRLADQAEFLLELVDHFGLPLRARIERGPWDNNFWFGIPLPRAWWQTEDCTSYRFGGIDAAAGGPIKVLQAFKSRHKGLMEGFFNWEQAVSAHLTTDIGRYRGEHERAAKLMSQVQSLKTPELLAKAIANFPDSVTAADITAQVIAQVNSMAKRRRTYWGHKKQVPAEVYAAGVNKRVLAPSDRWRFLPVKTAVTMSRSNLILKAKDYSLPFVFTAEGFTPNWTGHAYIPTGWRLFACFHPERPELGCHIFNAMHPDHAQNPWRIALGHPMGVLKCVETPAFSDRPGDFADRKKTQAAYRQETRLAELAGKAVRVSTVVAAGRSRTLRTGSADPLREISGPAAEAPTPARRDADDAAALAEVEAARANRIARLRQLEAEEALF